MLKQDFTINNAKFIRTANGGIIAGIITSLDSEKVCINNFTVHPDYDNNGVNEYLLCETIKHLSKSSSEENIYIQGGLFIEL